MQGGKGAGRRKEKVGVKLMKTYSLHLPVFKQGDDLAHCLESNDNDPVKGFLDLAKQYEAAAEMCKTVAGELSKVNTSNIDVDACTHCIWIHTSRKDVKELVKQKILVEEKFD